jgi:hypothetical protein
MKAHYVMAVLVVIVEYEYEKDEDSHLDDDAHVVVVDLQKQSLRQIVIDQFVQKYVN